AEVIGARHRIVHERARQQLSRRVISNVLKQGLAYPLGDAAVQLTFHQQWVDHVADVVNRRVAHQLDLAGCLVDFDLTDVTTVWESALAAVEGASFEQAGLHPLGNLGRGEGVARELENADRLVGAGDRELSGLEYDVVLGRLHQVSGDLGALGDNLLRRVDQRGATGYRRARAE